MLPLTVNILSAFHQLDAYLFNQGRTIISPRDDQQGEIPHEANKTSLEINVVAYVVQQPITSRLCISNI
jgi:hypothetical protein